MGTSERDRRGRTVRLRCRFRLPDREGLVDLADRGFHVRGRLGMAAAEQNHDVLQDLLGLAQLRVGGRLRFAGDRLRDVLGFVLRSRHAGGYAARVNLLVAVMRFQLLQRVAADLRRQSPGAMPFSWSRTHRAPPAT
jgi:hypothetical protein